MHHAEVCIAQSSIIVFIRVPCFGNQKSIFGAIMKSIAHSFCFMKQVSIGIEIEYALMYRRMFTVDFTKKIKDRNACADYSELSCIPAVESAFVYQFAAEIDGFLSVKPIKRTGDFAIIQIISAMIGSRASERHCRCAITQGFLKEITAEMVGACAAAVIHCPNRLIVLPDDLFAKELMAAYIAVPVEKRRFSIHIVMGMFTGWFSLRSETGVGCPLGSQQKCQQRRRFNWAINWRKACVVFGQGINGNGKATAQCNETGQPWRRLAGLPFSNGLPRDAKRSSKLLLR